MKILVPLDGSRNSENTLPLAGRLAEHWKAEVIALRVLDPTIGSGVDPLVMAVSESAYARMIQEAQDYLDGLAGTYAGIPLRTMYEVGEPGACIQEVTRREECSLILMATHGHSGFARWLWGSVAEGVARHANCPTMLVRLAETPVLFREILIPIDGSEPSLEVARHIGMFLTPETRVTLLHCTGAGEEQQAEARLRQHVDGRPWLRLECVAAPPPQGIFDWLAEHDCDLIAMSTHGRDGLAHLWNGSVMEEVARQSNCPVLVFPPGTLTSTASGGKNV
ncbi:MAG: universal stress protein [Candidatus Eremiobacteraeota bacterium]|nr:universal stress protein [Candidatus Eremiobacteraeota bacterium]MCW5868914.1 universal stress protein [Candidatus Eremiobacteraeota bacterium]